MATTEEVRDTGGLHIEYVDGGIIKVVQISSVDELFKFRLSEKRGPRVSLIKTRRLMADSKASGATLKFIATVIPRDLIADSLEVNPTNLAKLYQRKSLSRTQTEELEDLTHLWKEIQQDLFSGDEQMMKRWLDTPVPALDGETPKSLMGTITGRKVVEKYVQKLKYGDYS
jgi:putative toxin-antitoxin system antitoxin component (TIGR02293 family)